MTEEPIIAEAEIEQLFDPNIYLSMHFGAILKDMCCFILSDALENPEIWEDSELRSRIMCIASAVVKTACKETEQ